MPGATPASEPMPMTFDTYLAAFALGKVTTADLPRLAMQALEEGYDSTELAALAGSTAAERSPLEMQEMWRRGLRQLGKSLPGRAEAGRILRDHYAALVVSGSLPPSTGASEIADLVAHLEDVLPTRKYLGDGLGVAALVGLYYSYDDVPIGDEEAYREIDEEVRAECRRLSTEGGA